MYKFVYKVNEWWIIVGDGAHFYYNSVSKERSWSMPKAVDAEVLDFDYLALLFAKARGLGVEEGAERNMEVAVEETGEETGREIGDVGDRDVDDSMKTDEKHPNTHEKPSHTKAHTEPIHTTPLGLDLGYSSSDDDSGEEKADAEPEDLGASDSENDDPLTDDPQDLNDIINDVLGYSGDTHSDTDSDTDSTQAFVSLLNSLKPSINIYNPYSITEEELAEELVQHPVFYKLSPASKEKIYNDWATTAGETPSTYPSAKQVFMNKLFSIKSEVKSKYYFDLKSELAPFDYHDKESAFLMYKNILQTQTSFEKQMKKSSAPGVNLKKLKLLEFLDKHQVTTQHYQSHGSDDYQKWINMCNDLDLPAAIVENEINWLVGDSKRLECYLERGTSPSV